MKTDDVEWRDNGTHAFLSARDVAPGTYDPTAFSTRLAGVKVRVRPEAMSPSRIRVDIYFRMLSRPAYLLQRVAWLSLGTSVVLAGTTFVTSCLS